MNNDKMNMTDELDTSLTGKPWRDCIEAAADEEGIEVSDYVTGFGWAQREVRGYGHVGLLVNTDYNRNVRPAKLSEVARVLELASDLRGTPLALGDIDAEFEDAPDRQTSGPEVGRMPHGIGYMIHTAKRLIRRGAK